MILAPAESGTEKRAETKGGGSADNDTPFNFNRNILVLCLSLSTKLPFGEHTDVSYI